MIQKGTYLRVVDNSGASMVSCIHVYGGNKKRYAKMGDLVLVSIKTLRSNRPPKMKIKKGDVVKGLIVRTKIAQTQFSGSQIEFYKNCIVLLNDKFRPFGSRILVTLPSTFKKTRYAKLIALSEGIIN